MAARKKAAGGARKKAAPKKAARKKTAPKKATRKRSGTASRIEQEFPPTLGDFSRQVRRQLNALERNIEKTEWRHTGASYRWKIHHQNAGPAGEGTRRVTGPA